MIRIHCFSNKNEADEKRAELEGLKPSWKVFGPYETNEGLRIYVDHRGRKAIPTSWVLVATR